MTLKNHYDQDNLHSVEYEISTSSQQMCLALYFDKEKVAISVFDELKEFISKGKRTKMVAWRK